MRQQFLSEDEVSVPTSTLVTEPVVASTQRLPQEWQRDSTKQQRVRRTPDRSGMLRLGLLFFGSLGVFSLVLPAVTGVSVSEGIESADVRAAFSSVNLAYTRGAVALKLGNLSAATGALIALPGQSIEAEELAHSLLPALLKRKDYEHAAQVCGHLLRGTNRVRYDALRELQTHLLAQEGLESTMTIVQQNPAMAAIRSDFLPDFLSSVPLKERNALEKLTATLTGSERDVALGRVVSMYWSQEDLTQSWQWVVGMSPKERLQIQRILVRHFAAKKPEEVSLLLAALGTGVEVDRLRVNAVFRMAKQNPQLAERLAATISDPYEKLLAGVGLVTHSEEQTKKFALLVEQAFTRAELAGIRPRLREIKNEEPRLHPVYASVMQRLMKATHDPMRLKLYSDFLQNPPAQPSTRSLLNYRVER